MITRLESNMSEADYHSDPCPTPSLSASIAKIIDKQSPAHAFAAHPRLGGGKKRYTKALDHGQLTHKLLLGKGAEIVSVTADDWRTKAAQEARDEARAVGKVPILQKEHEAAWDAAGVLRTRIADLGIALDGRSEVSVFWQEKPEAGPVQCRGRFDHYIESSTHAQILDLKSCQSAHPEACKRHIDAYGYAIQRAAYVSAVEQIRPRFAGRVDFLFVFMELSRPYVVTPIRLSGEFRALGERQWKRSVEIWERCMRTETWPGYATEAITVEPPPWALVGDMAREAQEDFGDGDRAA